VVLPYHFSADEFGNKKKWKDDATEVVIKRLK
jgi:hypothetical protein